MVKLFCYLDQGNAEDLASELEALENAVMARGLAEEETEDIEEERGLDELTPREILVLFQAVELDPQSVFGRSEGAARYVFLSIFLSVFLLSGYLFLYLFLIRTSSTRQMNFMECAIILDCNHHAHARCLIRIYTDW